MYLAGSSKEQSSYRYLTTILYISLVNIGLINEDFYQIN